MIQCLYSPHDAIFLQGLCVPFAVATSLLAWGDNIIKEVLYVRGTTTSAGAISHSVSYTLPGCVPIEWGVNWLSLLHTPPRWHKPPGRQKKRVRPLRVLSSGEPLLTYHYHPVDPPTWVAYGTTGRFPVLTYYRSMFAT